MEYYNPVDNIENYKYIKYMIDWYIANNCEQINKLLLAKIQKKILKTLNNKFFNNNFFPDILENIKIKNIVLNKIIQLNPLGYAVYFGNFEIVKLLVTNGVNYNGKVTSNKRKFLNDEPSNNDILLDATYTELAFLKGFMEIKNYFDDKNQKNNNNNLVISKNNFGIYTTDLNNLNNGYLNSNYNSSLSYSKYSWIQLDENHLLLSVFDGHNGNFVSNYLSAYFAEYIQVRFEIMENKDPESISAMLKRAINHIDILICSILKKYNYSIKLGSTLSCVLITPNKIIGAWIGNSPIIIIDEKGNNVFVSENHTVKNIIEKNRCEKENCTFEEKYGVSLINLESQRDFHSNEYNNDLSVSFSRSIGYYKHKNILLSEADTTIIDKNKNFIIILCSNSFTESIKEKNNDLLFNDHIIGNNISNNNIVREIYPIIQKNNYDMQKAAKEIVTYRILKYKNSCNNTLLLLYSFI